MTLVPNLVQSVVWQDPEYYQLLSMGLTAPTMAATAHWCMSVCQWEAFVKHFGLHCTEKVQSVYHVTISALRRFT